MGKIIAYWFVTLLIGILTSGFFILDQPLDRGRCANFELTHSVERKLKRDAARLALRSMRQENALSQVPVQIPANLVSSFYEILSSLYNEDPTARLLEKCNVHTFPDPPIDHLVLVYSYTAEWTQPLTTGAKKTQHPSFEKLVQSHGLTIENQFKWDGDHGAISIRAENPLNAIALADEFLSIDGIVETDLSVPRTQGHDILAKKIGTGWEITYLMQFGVHGPSGTKQHTWQYHCLHSGEIKFIGENGDALPEWMACAK